MEMGNLYPAEENAAAELHFGERVEIAGGGRTRLGCRAQDLWGRKDAFHLPANPGYAFTSHTLHFICSYKHRIMKAGKELEEQVKTGHLEYLSLCLQNCNSNVKLN